MIVQHGMKRMYQDQEDVFYLPHPDERELPPPRNADGRRGRHHQGPLPHVQDLAPGKKHVNLMGSGIDPRAGDPAGEMLKEDFGVTSDIWSATSFTELARDGQDALRHNRLNPLAEEKVPYVTQVMQKASKGPVIAATDYVKNFAEQIRAFVPNRYTVLGTDGFGRSDSRENLRRFFEVDANHIAAAAMVDLYREGAVSDKDLQAALKKYDIDGGKPNPRLS